MFAGPYHAESVSQCIEHFKLIHFFHRSLLFVNCCDTIVIWGRPLKFQSNRGHYCEGEDKFCGPFTATNFDDIFPMFYLIFSLRRGDLIGRSCLSVCHSFLIFQKRGFEQTNIILSNTTKLILLDSLRQEFTYHKGHVRMYQLKIIGAGDAFLKDSDKLTTQGDVTTKIHWMDTCKSLETFLTIQQ